MARRYVTLDQAAGGWVVAECPALPGCASQGRDEKEALANIQEAIAVWLWAEGLWKRRVRA